MANTSGPGRFTFDTVTNALLVSSGGGGGNTNVNIAAINGTAPALSNPLPVELSDGTNALGVTGNPLFVNKAAVGGTNVQAAQTGSTDGTGANEVVRTINRRFGLSVTTSNPTQNTTVYFPGNTTTPGNSNWWDSNQTGAVVLEVTGYGNATTNPGTLSIEQADDPNDTTSGAVTNSAVGSSLQLTNNVAGTIQAALTKRYYRIKFAVAAVITFTSFKILMTENTVPLGPSINPASGAQVLDSASFSDGNTTNVPLQALGLNNAGAIRSSVPAAMGMIVCTAGPGAGGPFSMLRTPNVFRGSLITGGGGNVWTPTTAKKFRLMKYRIEAQSDIKMTTAGSLLLDFIDGSAQTLTPQPILQHLTYVPSAAGTGVVPWSTPWIDLGNGWISATANNALTLAINGPLASTTVNLPWTQTSGQWECAQFLFKTNSSNGVGASLYQGAIATPGSAASLAKAFPTNNLGGSLLVAIGIVKSSSATLTIADSLTNTWVAGTAQANATDGQTLRMFDCISAKVGAVNTVTLSSTVTAQLKLIILEYPSVGVFDTQSGATGNSAAPAPGNATAASLSDLVITCASNGGNANAVSAGTGDQLRATSSDANSTLSVGDNLGQAPASLVGAFNVECCGTEE
jgi:hypothetical protein